MRNCKNCEKEYDYAGYYCRWCSQKLREEKRKGIPCKSCNKIKPISNKSNHLCGLCYVKKRENDNPIYKEKKRIAKFKSRRKSRGQDPESPLMKNKAGDGYINPDGYKQLTKIYHPNSSKSGRIFEHRYIMSEYLKRPLKKNETVHHLNGIKNDNRIENLELWSKSQPAGQRVKDKIRWCKQFLEEYGIETKE